MTSHPPPPPPHCWCTLIGVYTDGDLAGAMAGAEEEEEEGGMSTQPDPHQCTPQSVYTNSEEEEEEGERSQRAGTPECILHVAEGEEMEEGWTEELGAEGAVGAGSGDNLESIGAGGP